jgi:hypothetical protein
MNMFAKTAVAVSVVPAASIVSSETAKALAPAAKGAGQRYVREPSAIEALWAQRQAIRTRYEAARVERSKLESLLMEKAPQPDRSITYGLPENDADGFKSNISCAENCHISSRSIKGELKKIEPSEWEKTTVDGCVALIERKRPLPLSAAKIALRDRLKERLKLSLEYEREIERISKAVGLKAAEKKVRRLASQLDRIERQILATKAYHRADFAIKLALYQDWHADNMVVDSIIDDIQNLVDIPGKFGDAWSFDPNEEIEKAMARKAAAVA